MERDGPNESWRRIERLILESGLTAYEIAKRTGIKEASFSQWKAGVHAPCARSLVKLARFFRVPVDQLVG